MCYSYEQYHQDKLREFIEYGEQKPPYSSLLNHFAPDGPKEEPLGVSLKLPPFKGWPADL